MSVDVEEANHLLRLASSVDVQTWNAALFYHLHSPLNDTCIDGLPGWKTVYRRAVCRLDNENVAPVRLGRFCRQGINAVNVSCVQDGGRWRVDKKLRRSQHVSRVQCSNLDAIDRDFAVQVDRGEIGNCVVVEGIVNISRLDG